VISDAGVFIWDVPIDHPEVITLTKWFHVEQGSWAETTLVEVLQGLNVEPSIRRVTFKKAYNIFLPILLKSYPQSSPVSMERALPAQMAPAWPDRLRDVGSWDR
jgi:hypothetical protein